MGVVNSDACSLKKDWNIDTKTSYEFWIEMIKMDVKVLFSICFSYNNSRTITLVYSQHINYPFTIIYYNILILTIYQPVIFTDFLISHMSVLIMPVDLTMRFVSIMVLYWINRCIHIFRAYVLKILMFCTKCYGKAIFVR